MCVEMQKQSISRLIYRCILLLIPSIWDMPETVELDCETLQLDLKLESYGQVVKVG